MISENENDEFIELDFEIKEGKNYVFSWGVEIKWIQYNPAHQKCTCIVILQLN